MKKQPLFDVSRFNRIADKHNSLGLTGFPLIETFAGAARDGLTPTWPANCAADGTDTG